MTRCVRFRRPQTGQTIYQAMLGISLVALAVAITFPVYEYIELYHKPPDVTPRSSTVAPTPPPATATETPAPVEKPGPREKTGPAEAPKPAG